MHNPVFTFVKAKLPCDFKNDHALFLPQEVGWGMNSSEARLHARHSRLVHPFTQGLASTLLNLIQVC